MTLKSILSGTLPNLRKGQLYERKAAAWLRQQGLKVTHCNVYSRYGEIDLIARHGEVMVFVEVRYRQQEKHGSPLATVTVSKQQKIRLTARHFLQKNGLTNKMPCRFDVIGITGHGRELEYRWIKNAF